MRACFFCGLVVGDYPLKLYWPNSQEIIPDEVAHPSCVEQARESLEKSKSVSNA